MSLRLRQRLLGALPAVSRTLRPPSVPINGNEFLLVLFDVIRLNSSSLSSGSKHPAGAEERLNQISCPQSRDLRGQGGGFLHRSVRDGVFTAMPPVAHGGEVRASVEKSLQTDGLEKL